MKETIAEYARILIVMMSFAMLIAFVFGGVWFKQLGKTSNAMENKLSMEAQDTAYDNLSLRKPPILTVSGTTIRVGQSFDLSSLINTATDYDNNNNLKKNVKIICNSADFTETDHKLTPSRTGVYKVIYTVSDSYGLTTTTTANIVVE